MTGIGSHSPSLSSYRLPANIVQPSESALRGVVPCCFETFFAELGFLFTLLFHFL
jgi:hypothetical protein